MPTPLIQGGRHEEATFYQYRRPYDCFSCIPTLKGPLIFLQRVLPLYPGLPGPGKAF